MEIRVKENYLINIFRSCHLKLFGKEANSFIEKNIYDNNQPYLINKEIKTIKSVINNDISPISKIALLF